jgi:hypothetical protein
LDTVNCPANTVNGKTNAKPAVQIAELAQSDQREEPVDDHDPDDADDESCQHLREQVGQAVTRCTRDCPVAMC